MNGNRHLIAKSFYGALFVVIIPLFLLFFSDTVKLPISIESYPLLGGVLSFGGLFVMLWGMLALLNKGKGLPMNAFPPRKLVSDGIYGVIPHPIYFGFVILCLGFSLYAGSAVGTFLTTPLVAAAVVALSVGYENIELRKRFGELPVPIFGSKRLLLPVLSPLGLVYLWKFLLNKTEQLANSWKSYRFGPVRIMNHVWFSGLSGGTGAFLVVLVSGREQFGTVTLLTVSAIIGAALIGQLLEGMSNRLSRPFGYFGGLLGIVIAGVLLSFFRDGILLVLTAFCLAGPWTQAIGRLRCIVQGCCHGMPATPETGIVIINEHSRVCGMAQLGGTPIYPTQLYSIIGNVFLGFLLCWLWGIGTSMTLISGLYLTLAGVTRFIEEGYRGEPQTKNIAGLHIYQWFAVLMYVAGMVVMLFRSASVPPVDYGSLPLAVFAGVIFFLVCGFAMSIDFPDSTIRFSRLSG